MISYRQLFTALAVVSFIAMEIGAGLVITEIAGEERYASLLIAIAPALMALRGNTLVPYLYRAYTYIEIEGRRDFLSFTAMNICVSMATGVIASCIVVAAAALAMHVDMTTALDVLCIAIASATVAKLIGIAILTYLVYSYALRPQIEVEDFIPTTASGLMDLLTPVAMTLPITVCRYISIATVIAIAMLIAYAATRRRLRWIARNVCENVVSSLASLVSLVGGLVVSSYRQYLLRIEALKAYPLINAFLGIVGGLLYGSITTDLHIYGEIRRSDLFEGLRKSFTGILIVGIAIVLVSTRAAAICISALTLGSLILLAVTLALSKASIKLGLDPDNVVFPLVTGVGDLTGSTVLTILTLLFVD